MRTTTTPLIFAAAVLSLLATFDSGPCAHGQSDAPPPKPAVAPSTMNNPYRLVAQWPHLGNIKPGAAIGIVPDGTGGLWLQHRSVPGVLHINAAGNIIGKWDVAFASAHGFCRDTDGNFWVLDSGPFTDTPDAGVKGNQVFKYTPDGTRLLTIGKAGVSKAGPDTFLQPSACAATPSGDIVIADGHWSRPSGGPQNGDRLVFYKKDGTFIKSFGTLGAKPGEFMGPHALAFDSRGRLFVADRSNNRIQIFDKNMNYLDEWRQFGRPSGLVILKDDTLIVSDSESTFGQFKPAELGPVKPGDYTVDWAGFYKGIPRNAGWRNGIRVGSAKDGSFKYFIPDVLAEGLGADEFGNIYGGLTTGCEASPSGGCLQKYVLKTTR
jgi:sugar lactone lactonase YvrE